MMKDLPACRVRVAADGGHNSQAASAAPRRGRDLVGDSSQLCCREMDSGRMKRVEGAMQ